jgi:hypothetical protein
MRRAASSDRHSDIVDLQQENNTAVRVPEFIWSVLEHFWTASIRQEIFKVQGGTYSMRGSDLSCAGQQSVTE